MAHAQLYYMRVAHCASVMILAAKETKTWRAYKLLLPLAIRDVSASLSACSRCAPKIEASTIGRISQIRCDLSVT